MSQLRKLILCAIISASFSCIAEEVDFDAESPPELAAAAAPAFVVAPNLATDRAQVPEVLQDQYLIASLKQYPAIQTYGVSTCIAVTLYDPTLKQGAMLHVSASTDIPQAISLVTNELARRGSNPFNLQAEMYGGWGDSMSMDPTTHYTSREMANQLYYELSQKGAVIIQNQTVTERTDTDRPAIYDVELDLQTGAVYRFQPAVPYNRASPALALPTNPLHGG